ncbi:MAG: transglutaminase, partial [Nitrospirae bacterium CG06_land_8_20_14_3_00_70_43]
MATAGAETAPEIVELARGLQHDPTLIYEFVHNTIDYVPYFGALKGAVLTLTEGAGNDFDQAALMVALLRASGFTAQFVYGQQFIPAFGAADQHDLHHWLGVDANGEVLSTVLGSAGIPVDTATNPPRVTRVWVKATIAGIDYLFDPAFKVYQETVGIDVAAAMGYDRTALLTAAGGTAGADSVENLNDPGLRTALTSLSSTLVDNLRAHHPNASMEEVIGGREIVPEYLGALPTTLPFANITSQYWDTVPDAYLHKVRIQHGGIDQTLPISEVAGKRLAIAYDTGVAAVAAVGSASSAVAGEPTPRLGTLESPQPLALEGLTLTPPLPEAEPWVGEPRLTVPAPLPPSQPILGDANLEQGAEPSAAPLTAGGLAPLAAVATWDFGRVTPTSDPSTITTSFTNNKAFTITVTNSLLAGTSSAYSILQGGGVTTLVPGQLITIKLQFSGTLQARGTKTGTFRMRLSCSGCTPVDQDYALTGFVADAPNVSNSSGINFRTFLNQPIDATARLQNSGSLTLTINSVSLTGTDAARFQIVSGGGAGGVAAGGFRNIAVRYLGTPRGTHTANLHVTFTYDGIAGNTADLSLQGKTVLQPNFTGSYGINVPTYLHQPIDATARLQNSGSLTLTINSVSLTGTDAARFQIVSGGGAGNIAAGGFRAITVRYLATVRGSHTANLHITYTYDGIPGYTVDLPLQGQTVLQPDLTGSLGVDFGQRYLGDPLDRIATLKNSGTLNLVVNSVTLTGTDGARFQLLTGTGSGTLTPGQSRAIGVRYLANAVGVHAASIHVTFTYDGIANAIDLGLAGETLSVPSAQLWLDDTLLVQEATPVSGPNLGDLTVTIDHPYAGTGGTFGDQTSTYHLKRGGSTYVLISDFGASHDGRLLAERQRRLEAYRASGLVDTSREVVSESLNVMGQTWMEQTTLSDRLLAELADVVAIRHHRFGIVAQEQGYYIDVKTQYVSTISRHNVPADAEAVFKSMSFLNSALEHGVLEQLQGFDRPAASTIKLLTLANAQGQKLFLANAGNYAAIRSQLTGYSTADLDDFDYQVHNQSSTLLLPTSGQIDLLQWRGKGYVTFGNIADGNTHMGMIIGGDYYGGYGAYPAPLSIPSLVTDFVPELRLDVEKPHPTTIEPVDLVTGAYLYDHTDLALGGGEPHGLAFRRAYNSDERHEVGSLGHGWSHGYDVALELHSDVAAGLGMRSPVDAAALLVSSTVTLSLMTPAIPAVKEWATAVLTAGWAMDELFENAVSTRLQDSSLTFVRLPDGSFNPAPGVTTDLVQVGSLYELRERFGTVLAFNAARQLTTWRDVDGNTLTLTYTGGRLTSITDAHGRKLTLTYTGERLTKVSDTTGRSITYGYNASDDLVSVTDPAGKVWGYGYDADHRITTVADPLGVTLATNHYDPLGRVDTQTVPRQGGVNATYHFFFTGPRNVEEDPDGGQTVYHFDDKGRTVAVEDAMGHRSTTAYDGQNHPVAATDPRGNTTTIAYDGAHNLTGVTDALGFPTVNTYDAQNRLIATTDPLLHTTHFAYDVEHHLTLTTDAVTHTTSATYYANGQTATITDGRGTGTTLTYDANGHPNTTKVGAHPVVDEGYDAIGRRTSLIDQVGATTTFTFDPRGLLGIRTDPLGRTTTHTYDGAGRLTAHTDRNGKTITYGYTPSGKVATTTYPVGTPVSLTYDLRDNLVAMADSMGTTTYTYDAANRLTAQTNPHGFTVGYAYDASGNLTTLTYPGDKAVTYTYDALNRLATVSNWLGQTATYTYDQAGRLTQLVGFNGTVTTYGYDAADRLISLTNQKSDHMVLASYGFNLDGNGNRTAELRNEPLAPSGWATENVPFTYNAPRNRVVTAGTDTFTFDNEGSLATKTATPYTFDDEHRLTYAGGTNWGLFAYDGAGNRLAAWRRGAAGTRYVYDASGNLLAEANGSNQILRYYVYG